MIPYLLNNFYCCKTLKFHCHCETVVFWMPSVIQLPQSFLFAALPDSERFAIFLVGNNQFDYYQHSTTQQTKTITCKFKVK